MGTVPCVCTSWISMGSVLGSRKNIVTASLSPRRAVMTGCKICGWGASMSSTCWRVLARWGWRAGHSPDRRWATSPGTWPHPGRRQAPDSWVQCLLSQHDLYLPLSIFPITVAFLLLRKRSSRSTKVDEHPARGEEREVANSAGWSEAQPLLSEKLSKMRRQQI